MQVVMWIEPAVAILQHKKRGYLQQPEQVDRQKPCTALRANTVASSLFLPRWSALVEGGRVRRSEPVPVR